MAQSRRVACTISMMVRTPLPSSPIISPQALSYSTSLEALERSASLSLRRITLKPLLREPSGHQRGTRKHDGESLPFVLASVRNTSHIGAEVNHYNINGNELGWRATKCEYPEYLTL
jgi:hypothetical protein